MHEVTLEELARRVEVLECMLNIKPGERQTPKDWRAVVGMFSGSDFMKQVDAEGRTIREREREEARQED